MPTTTSSLKVSLGLAFSIEARVPFLDYRLVEWAFSLPPALKIDKARTKAVLRDAMKGTLVERVRERQDKKGYPTPFSQWVRTTHRAWLDALVINERGLTDQARVRAMLDQHRAGQEDHGFRLFQLATLEIFCRRYIDGALELEPPPVGAKLTCLAAQSRQHATEAGVTGADPPG
mgnify:CR=1 FL=1